MLEETVLGSEAVERLMVSKLTDFWKQLMVTHVVGLTHGTDLTAKSVGVVLALDGLSVGVDVSDHDLNRGVVLGGDQATSGSAVAGDVEVNEDTCLISKARMYFRVSAKEGYAREWKALGRR